MRYDPRRRIEYPDAEDVKVWGVLDYLETQGIRHEKLPRVAPKGASKREHWYPLAKVWYNEEDYFLLEYQEDRKLGQKHQNKVNVHSKRRIEERRKTWTEKMNLDILYLSRSWANWMIKHQIEDKIKEREALNV